MIFIILWIISFCVFAQAIMAVFGLYNDYTLFSNLSQSSIAWLNSEHQLPLTQWLAQTILQWQSHFTGNIEALFWWRLLGFVSTLIVISLLMQMLIMRGVSRGLSIFAGLWLMALPAISVGFLWAIHVLPGSINLLIALMAWGFIDHGFSKGLLPKSWLDWLAVISGLLLLLLSLWIYYPTACLFFVPSFIRWLWSGGNNPDSRLLLWRDVFIFILVTGLFWAIDRWVMVRWMHAAAAVNPSSYWFSLTPKWLILKQTLLSSIAGVWQLFPSLVKIMLAMEGMTWLLLGFYAGFRRVDFWVKAMRLLTVVLILCTVVVLPLLFMPTTSGVKGVRVLVVPMIIMVLSKIWFIDELNPLASRRLRRVLAAFWLIIILGSVYFVNLGLVKWHVAELMALESSVMQAKHKPDVTTIYIEPLHLKKQINYANVPYELSYFMSDGYQLKAAFDILSINHGILSSHYDLVLIDKDFSINKDQSIITRVEDFLP